MKALLGLIFINMLTLNIVEAKIINVPADQPTIQAGIDDAIDGDTVLVADGTYTGDGNIYLNYGGKAIVVKSENGPEKCIIDCIYGAGYQAFIFDKGETTDSVADGFTLKNGCWVIMCINSSPTIINNIITNNNLGIYCEGSSAVIKNNIIAENIQGIRCDVSSPSIIGNRISDNHSAYSTSKGGGIKIFKTISDGFSAIINNNIIENNTAGYGGGIYCENSTTSIINNTIIGNSAINGGGIYSYQSSPVISNNIVAFSKKWSPDMGEPKLSEYSWTSRASTYQFAGGSIQTVTFNSGFQNTGGTGDVTISVPGLQNKTITVNSNERYIIIVVFSAQNSVPGTASEKSINVISSVDTLIIKAKTSPSYVYEYMGLFYSVKLNDAESITLTSDGIPATYAGGIMAVESNPEITYCDIYDNEDGNYFVGETLDSTDEVVLTGIDGNISQDPLCSAPNYLLSEGSPCIDAGNPESAYNDSELPPGKGTERCDIGACGGSENDITIISSVNDYSAIPSQFLLYQNYPNPFNPTTTINYSIPINGLVSLEIFDILGRKIISLVNEEKSAGEYAVLFDASELSNGIYFYRLQMNKFKATKKLLLVK
ncbi:T9SS type A sorting domain-containing protein [Candidatus Latescibacterota bacterium]